MSSSILITGGLGYIGSHTVLNFVQHTQNKITVVDNCINSDISTLSKLKNLSDQEIIFYQADVTDYSKMVEIISKEKIDSVIHFAASKSVSGSIQNPAFYYQNNVIGLMILLRAMRCCGVKKIIFSSSATVYSSCNNFPVDENGKLGYSNPYGQTKLIGEDILLREHEQSDLNVNILRYFNPLGNESSGHLGDNIYESATNIMPMILKALRHKKKFFIYGHDYSTRDGSPVRDYIHVCDLARAHRLTFESLEESSGYDVMNIGQGFGVSVLELISTFNAVNDLKIPIEYKERRDGDLSVCYADINKIKKQLGWQPQYNLSDMCRDAYCFYKNTA